MDQGKQGAMGFLIPLYNDRSKLWELENFFRALRKNNRETFQFLVNFLDYFCTSIDDSALRLRPPSNKSHTFLLFIIKNTKVSQLKER